MTYPTPRSYLQAQPIGVLGFLSHSCSTFRSHLHFRLIVPVRRFLLPESESSLPIPSLTNRQFVLTEQVAGDLIQRELFWYREHLFKHVRLGWKEVS